MSKLGDRVNITLGAVTTIIRLYKNEPNFENEFQQICQFYRDPIQYFILCWIKSHREAVVLPEREYQVMLDKLKRNLVDKQVQDFNPDLCILALDELAWRWKLRLPGHLAGFNLFIDKVSEEVKSLGIKIQEGPVFHLHFSAQSSPLKMEIPSWLIIEYGQEEVVKQVRAAISKYTKQLREKGLSDYPSSLKKHAAWWLGHYVHGKTYPELAEEYAYGQETIKRKVWEFRKLLHIELR